MCFWVFMNEMKNDSSFRVNGRWFGLVQLVLLGTALISIDKTQMGSAYIFGLADTAVIIYQLTPFDKAQPGCWQQVFSV